MGDKAPDFTLVTKTAEGPQLFKLSDSIGKSNIVLLFVPMAFTGVCPPNSAHFGGYFL